MAIFLGATRASRLGLPFVICVQAGIQAWANWAVITDAPEIMHLTYSKLHSNIQDAFNGYGVQIMSPNYMMDRAHPTVVPRERWFEPPAKIPQPKEEK